MKSIRTHQGSFVLPIGLLMFVFISLFYSGCKQNNSNRASGTIGIEGGIIEITDTTSAYFGTILEVPEGSLESDVDISFRVIESTDNVSITPTIELKPDGLHFNKGAYLQIPITAKLYDYHYYVLTYLDEKNDRFHPGFDLVPLTPSDNFITTEIYHFSKVNVRNAKDFFMKIDDKSNAILVSIIGELQQLFYMHLPFWQHQS